MKNIITIILLITSFVAVGQIDDRPPLEAGTVKVLYYLTDNGEFIWQGDTIMKDSLVYFRMEGNNCFSIKHLSDTDWSGPYCFSEEGASDSLFSEFSDKWLSNGDTIYEDDSLFYYKVNECNCIQFRRIGEQKWTTGWCPENGESNLYIDENADRNLRIMYTSGSGDKLRFADSIDLVTTQDTTFYKFKVLGKDDSEYDWQSNIGLLDNVTIIGQGAGATGFDSIQYRGNTKQKAYKYDSLIDNTIIIGHHAQATKENQAVIGDTTIDELLTYGNVSAKGYQIGADTLYTRHLILNEADSGKWLQHFGDSLKFENIVFPVDSFYIGDTWISSGDSLLLEDGDTCYWQPTSDALSNFYILADTVTIRQKDDSGYSYFRITNPDASQSFDIITDFAEASSQVAFLTRTNNTPNIIFTTSDAEGADELDIYKDVNIRGDSLMMYTGDGTFDSNYGFLMRRKVAEQIPAEDSIGNITFDIGHVPSYAIIATNGSDVFKKGDVIFQKDVIINQDTTGWYKLPATRGDNHSVIMTDGKGNSTFELLDTTHIAGLQTFVENHSGDDTGAASDSIYFKKALDNGVWASNGDTVSFSLYDLSNINDEMEPKQGDVLTFYGNGVWTAGSVPKDTFYFENKDKWLSSGDTISVDTTNISGLQTFVENHSTGGSSTSQCDSTFISLYDTPDAYNNNSKGFVLSEDTDKVEFNSSLGIDDEGVWAQVADPEQVYDYVINAGKADPISYWESLPITFENAELYSSGGYTGIKFLSADNKITYNFSDLVDGAEYHFSLTWDSYETSDGCDSVKVVANGVDSGWKPTLTNYDIYLTGTTSLTLEVYFKPIINPSSGQTYITRNYPIYKCPVATHLYGTFNSYENSFRLVDDDYNTIYKLPTYLGSYNQVLVSDGINKLKWGNTLKADTIVSLTADTVYIPTLRVDTIYIGNEAITSASDSLYFENDSTWLTNGDTLSIDTTNISGLQTFVENHSTGGSGSSQWEDKQYGIHYPNTVTIGDTAYHDWGNLNVWSDTLQWAAINGFYYDSTAYGSMGGAWSSDDSTVISYGVYGWSQDGYGLIGVSNNGYSGYFYGGGKGVLIEDSLTVGYDGTKISRTGSMAEKDFWSGTQTEYDALGTYDENTVYFIYN